MYSKTLLIAICALVLCASCASLPWSSQPRGEEVNLAFTIEKNLLVVSTISVQGRRGRFVLGTAEQRTVFDAAFARSLALAGGAAVALQLSEKEAAVTHPLIADLHGTADGILGADVWGNHAVSVDYVSGLITYQKEGIHPESMALFRFTGEPKINVVVDGKRISAVVDTTSPDTIVLPRGAAPARRAKASVAVADTNFGTIDIAYGDVIAPRVGNRVLSKFLITIDYGRREVGLWRDPRTPL
jgi:hypothetical protein